MICRHPLIPRVVGVCAFVSLIFAAACDNRPAEAEPTTPPDGVPAEASVADSPHGDVWLVCAEKGSAPDRFECSVYIGSSSELWSTGEYVMRRVEGSGQKRVFLPVAIRPVTLDYESWDREVIRLADGLALVPDGLIDFPVDDKIGIKQLYVEGEEVGEPTPYER